MHVIAYTSEIIDTGNEDEIIKDIISASKKNNSETGITGVLFYHEGRFLQVIEGEEEDLRELMEHIKKDTRHKNVTYLIDDAERERCFGSWKMDEVQLGKGKDFDLKNLEQITKNFKTLMIPSCDTLVHFYKTLLAERKRIMGVF